MITNDFTNEAPYGRPQKEDPIFVPYNPDLTLRYKAHIDVERTQGGGIVAYLMKNPFNDAKEQEVVLSSRDEAGTGDGMQSKIYWLC